VTDRPALTRRGFLIGSSALAGSASLRGLAGILSLGRAPAVIAAETARPQARWGLQTGDVSGDRAIVWSRADRPAHLQVEWSLDPGFKQHETVAGPLVTAESDFTGRIDLQGLPPDRTVHLRVHFEDASRSGARSAPVVGQLRTPPAASRPIRFVWGGDTAGQGWGIDLASGGMRCYETMRAREPDFFLHSGDTIYADGPMQETVETAQGIWRNAFLDVVPEKTRVAQTQLEFHRAYLYNLHDAHLLRFNAEVPQLWQWDDHEVVNNWSPGKDLRSDARFQETDIAALSARAARAFVDYAPMRPEHLAGRPRIYRRVPYGPDLDVFLLDMRAYRAANSFNRQSAAGPDTAYLGADQIAWLKRQLAASTATWKVIAADMPIGLIVGDGEDAQGRPRFEASANGDGPVLGREFEIAEILRFIKAEGIHNTVWLTADVHYCAAHRYEPARARFTDFLPFWEFVAGPLHAGTFGPNALDDTFGPAVVYQKAPPEGQLNLPPSAGYQFFGQVDIDPEAGTMRVSLVDTGGATLFSQVIEAQAR